MTSFEISGRSCSFLAPYVIAEIGVNHEGSLERAKRMIDGVAAGGAHAAKFQTYKAGRLASADSSPAYWDRDEEPVESQFALFRRWDTFGPDEYRTLAAHCENRGIDFLSTPFDLDAVDLLDPLAPAFKIASADVTNIPLLRKVGRTGKPVLMSTGAARLDEIATALQTLNCAGAGPVALLHCVLNYPTAPDKAQLAQISLLSSVFGRECAIGYSDHVKPDPDGAMPALEVAVMLGAIVIEKHFTDNKSAPGNDHYHAMDTADLARFTNRIRDLHTLYGSPLRTLSSEHAAIENARRRIFAARAIAAGETLTEADLVALRSNKGIEVAHWDSVVGRVAARSLAKGAAFSWRDIA